MLALVHMAAIAAPVPTCYTWNTPEWLANTVVNRGKLSRDELHRLGEMKEAGKLPSHCCKTCYNGLLMSTWYYTEIDSTGDTGSTWNENYFSSGNGDWPVDTERVSSGSSPVEAQFVCNICVSKAYCKSLNMIVNEWHHTCSAPGLT